LQKAKRIVNCKILNGYLTTKDGDKMTQTKAWKKSTMTIKILCIILAISLAVLALQLIIKESEISEKNNEMSAVQNQLASKQSQVKAQAALIETLRNEASEKQSEISNLTSVVASLDSQIDNLNSHIQSLNQQITSLLSNSNQAQSNISALQDQINQLRAPTVVNVGVGGYDSAGKYLNVYGWFCNVGDTTAYNVRLHVTGTQLGGVLAIDTYFQISDSILGWQSKQMSTTIPYSGTGLVDFTMTPVWTSTP
jgi:peptidoglycan hydrolase CwlO-like protein